MAQLLAIAFTMGLAGSLHCVGMCGPLALALPLNRTSLHAKFAGALLYNLGRITTYSALGGLFGLLGKSIALFGWQQALSIAAGVAILLYLLLPRRFTAATRSNIVSRLMLRLRYRLSSLFAGQGSSTVYTIGLLNGLLPCGLVYMAMTGAVAMGNVGDSVLFMVLFGAGTLPAMWAVAFFGNLIGLAVRKKIRAAYPLLMGCMACILIIRGLGLGIPYVSPKAVAEKKVIECCARP